MLMPAEEIEVTDALATEAAGRRPRILVCVPRYLPGFKSGGPIRSISNMVANLSPHYDFRVVTRDRDATDTVSFPGVSPGKWHQVAGARVLYCSSIRQEMLLDAYREVRPDLILLNSFHDTFTRAMLLLRRRGRLNQTPIILAPRGEFSTGALQIKHWKKLLYRSAAGAIGLYDNLDWHATTGSEKDELLRANPARRLEPGRVHVASSISETRVSRAPHPSKSPGDMRLVFLARISEMKNLDFLLDALRDVKGKVYLGIFGPIAERDMPYWKTCKGLLDGLPAGVVAEYHGPVDHSDVPRILHEHHFFVLPTKGENFCHSAVEALINGTPVLLSDRTPWTNLGASNAGFDISLKDRARWVSTLQSCVDMDQHAYSQQVQNTIEYSRRFSVQDSVSEHIVMFRAALNSAAAASRLK